MRTRNN